MTALNRAPSMLGLYCMQLTNLILIVILSSASFLAACSSPKSKFINSYKAVWNMENKIGLEYRGEEVAHNRLIATGALSIWTGREELLRRSHSFSDFELSLSEQHRKEVIRATLRELMQDIGCTFPFDDITTSNAVGGRTFPWSNYMSADEYRQIAHDKSCVKSVFAQKAWWMRDYAQLGLLPGL